MVIVVFLLYLFAGVMQIEAGVEREWPRVQPMTPSNPNEYNHAFDEHKIKVCVSYSWLCFGTTLTSRSDK